MVNLRPYQLEVIAKVDAAIDAGKRRPLIVAPTGAGKTVVAAALVKAAIEHRGRVLFLAHRRELIHQAHHKLFQHGIDAGLVLAGTEGRPHVAVQVASVQTLWARAMRSRAMELPEADLVIVDEAHHVRAQTYQKIIEAYGRAIVIGLTATPCRGDGRGLGKAFDCIVECPPVQELIDLAFLVPTKVFAPTRPDLSGVQVQRGDYVEKQLAEVMDTGALIGDIVTHWHKLAERRKTVVFATGVAHSVHLRDEFRRSGVMAEHIDGSTPAEERDAILAKLARGSIDLVCNCMVLTEGWDSPEVSCIVLARPTKSMGLYRQMVGRVLRPAPGKADALVLDHAGAVFTHGFVEEAIEWTLREDRRAESPAQRSRAAGTMPTLTTCPECSAVRWEGRPCSSCGWRPAPRARAVDVADGELGRVGRDRRVKAQDYGPDDRRRFHAQLLYIARERGYAQGWAAHKFKEKFGSFPDSPPWSPPSPLPPDDATRSWVRSRQIAYAKAMQKAAGG
jgi:superfamily II DNA or RNA helicase